MPCVRLLHARLVAGLGPAPRNYGMPGPAQSTFSECFQSTGTWRSMTCVTGTLNLSRCKRAVAACDGLRNDVKTSAETTVARWFHLFIALGMLIATDITLQHIFVKLSWPFPPALCGMFIIMATLAVVETTTGEIGLDRAYAAIQPALDWLGRWLPLFFVPVMITISQSIKGLMGVELAKFGAVVAIGMVASLFATGCTAKAIRSVANTEVEDTSATASTAPFQDSHYFAWASVAASALALNAVAPQYAQVCGVAFTLASTVFGFVAASGLPARFRQIFHPIIVCGTIGFSGVAVWSNLQNISIDQGLKAFLSKGAGPWGAGDILMALLGPVILSFGFRIYAQRALMKRHCVEIFGTVIISSLFSLFATAFVAAAIGLPPPLARALIPRSVTVALALPMATQLGAPLPLAAAAVCVTGLLGANFCRTLLDAFGFRDPITRGLATAGSAHGLGTAALAAKEPAALPFCALAYALMGIVSNVLVTLPFIRGALLALTG